MVLTDDNETTWATNNEPISVRDMATRSRRFFPPTVQTDRGEARDWPWSWPGEPLEPLANQCIALKNEPRRAGWVVSCQ